MCNMYGLVQDCGILSASAMEIVQPCTKPSSGRRQSLSLKLTTIEYQVYAPLTKQLLKLKNQSIQRLTKRNKNSSYTLCGISLLRAGSCIFVSSAAASSRVLPFIRASVWARKLAARIWITDAVLSTVKPELKGLPVAGDTIKSWFIW